MNDSEPFDSAPDSGTARPANLEAQFEGLRKLFFAALVAVLILSVSLNVFLVRQTIFARNDLKTVRPQVNQLSANYQQAEDPQIKGFINALAAFARTNPDFAPILTKYKIPPTGLPVTPAESSPAPVAPKK